MLSFMSDYFELHSAAVRSLQPEYCTFWFAIMRKMLRVEQSKPPLVFRTTIDFYFFFKGHLTTHFHQDSSIFLVLCLTTGEHIYIKTIEFFF